MRRATLAALALLCLSASAAQARVIVYDRFGGQIPAEGFIQENGKYVLTLEDGTQVSIDEGDVTRVETVVEEPTAEAPTPEGEVPTEEAGVVRAGAVDAGPLVEALDFPDKRARVHAARTLVAARPEKDFYASRRVMEVLSDAIGTLHVRVVLIVTSDRDVGNLLAEQVRQMGAVPDVAIGGIEGIRRAKRFPAKDLVILDTTIAPGEDPQAEPTESFPVIRTVREGDREVLDERLKYSREVFLNLREDFRTAQVPIVLITDPNTEGEAGRPARRWTEQIYRNETYAALLERGASAESLAEALDRIFRGDERLAHDPKAAGEAMATSACESVASIDPEHTIFDLSLVRGALIAAVDEPPGTLVRPDTVRLPGLAALGVAGDESTYEALLRVFTNTQNVPEIRQAAIAATGRIIDRSGRIRAPVYGALKAMLAENDPRIWQTAAIALGLARLPGSDVTPLFVQERIQGAQKR